MDKKFLPVAAVVLVVFVGVAAYLVFNQPKGNESGEENVLPSGGSEPDGIVFETVDGNEISLDELLSKGKPLLIYFFTTWCPTCESDLKSLNQTYGGFEDSVEVLVVGFDPTESLEKIKGYKEARNYMWLFAGYNEVAITRFQIVTQSSKVGLDADGEVVFSEGFGVVSNEGWLGLLQKLAP